MPIIPTQCPTVIIPTLTNFDISVIEGNSYTETFAFIDSNTNQPIPLPVNTLGVFKVSFDYKSTPILEIQLVIDSLTNTAQLNLVPSDTNGLGVANIKNVIYKYVMTFTLPDNTTETYQSGNFIVVSNITASTP